MFFFFFSFLVIREEVLYDSTKLNFSDHDNTSGAEQTLEFVLEWSRIEQGETMPTSLFKEPR